FRNQRICVRVKKFRVRGGNSRKLFACHGMATEKNRAARSWLEMRRSFLHDAHFRAACVGYQRGCRRLAGDFRKEIEGYANGQRDINQIRFGESESQISGKC